MYSTDLEGKEHLLYIGFDEFTLFLMHIVYALCLSCSSDEDWYLEVLDEGFQTYTKRSDLKRLWPNLIPQFPSLIFILAEVAYVCYHRMWRSFNFTISNSRCFMNSIVLTCLQITRMVNLVTEKCSNRFNVHQRTLFQIISIRVFQVKVRN